MRYCFSLNLQKSHSVVQFACYDDTFQRLAHLKPCSLVSISATMSYTPVYSAAIQSTDPYPASLSAFVIPYFVFLFSCFIFLFDIFGFGYLIFPSVIEDFGVLHSYSSIVLPTFNSCHIRYRFSQAFLRPLCHAS